MNRIIKRLIPAAIAAAVLPLAVAQAASAPAAVTGPATNVGGSLATLTGQVVTAGQPTTYEFEYGTSTAYGSHTALHSTSTTKNVSEVVTGLTPGTTYHYRLDVVPQGGTEYGVPQLGSDMTFKTFTAAQVGSLKLLSKNLTVKHGKVTMRLRCASSLSCKGKLTIKHKGTGCVRGKHFSLGAGSTKRVKAAVSAGCTSLLGTASSHSLPAKLKTSLTTVQPNLKKGVKLIRR